MGPFDLSDPWLINTLWPRVSRWTIWQYSRMGTPNLCTVMWQYNHIGSFNLAWSMADKHVVAQSEQVSHLAIFLNGPTKLMCYYLIIWPHGPKPFIGLNVHAGPVNQEWVAKRNSHISPPGLCAIMQQYCITTWAHTIILTGFIHWTSNWDYINCYNIAWTLLSLTSVFGGLSLNTHPVCRIRGWK